MPYDIVAIGSATVDVFVTPASKEIVKHHAHQKCSDGESCLRRRRIVHA